MDNGTRLRSFFEALAALVGAYYTYQGLLDDLLNELGLGKESIIIALVAVIAMILTNAAATYYNNDFTEIAAQKTGEMRQAKKEQAPDYEGEKFFDDEEEDEDESDEAADDEE